LRAFAQWRFSAPVTRHGLKTAPHNRPRRPLRFSMTQTNISSPNLRLAWARSRRMDAGDLQGSKQQNRNSDIREEYDLQILHQSTRRRCAGAERLDNDTPLHSVGWDRRPTSVIDCSKNLTTPPFQQSSKAWCCSLTNSRGVFAYSQPDPHDPHQSLTHIVSTIPALPYDSSSEIACSMGH
jgi:hypothetical protein